MNPTRENNELNPTTQNLLGNPNQDHKTQMNEKKKENGMNTPYYVDMEASIFKPCWDHKPISKKKTTK